ncbi:MAG TPA: hypothetical protein VLK35_19705 [Methylomirabilota bacterium]|nr:hypothetical protein [Methylomirabilota bacterium]
MPALLVLALLAMAAPAVAHVTVSTPSTPSIEAPRAAEIVPILRGAPAAPALPWCLAAGLALGAAALWRRPRAAVVVTLVLVLGVFAFENALHSVHHGFDPQQQAECAVAAVSAQLAAVEVGGVGLASVALAAVGRAGTAPPLAALARFPSPDQGRAPPSAIL